MRRLLFQFNNWLSKQLAFEIDSCTLGNMATKISKHHAMIDAWYQ